jgi:hypothetical protein
MSWDRRFNEPIVLLDGSTLTTLGEAGVHILKLPKSEQKTKEWQEATHFLIEAAEHGGAVMFAYIGVLRVLNRPVERVLEPSPKDPMGIERTMQQVQQLKTDHVDLSTRERETSLSSPEVIEVIGAIVSSPAAPVELSEPTSTQREGVPMLSIKPTDDRSLITSETLQSAITDAVKKAEPACEAFVGVIVERTTPKSRFDANWVLRGVKFGRADREKANKTVTAIIERMQREFRLPDD